MNIAHINQGFFDQKECDLINVLKSHDPKDFLFALGMINQRHNHSIVSEYGRPEEINNTEKLQKITFYSEIGPYQALVLSYFEPYATALNGAILSKRASIEGYQLLTADEIASVINHSTNTPLTAVACGRMLTSLGFVGKKVKREDIPTRVYPVIRLKAESKNSKISSMIHSAGFKSINKILSIEF